MSTFTRAMWPTGCYASLIAFNICWLKVSQRDEFSLRMLNGYWFPFSKPENVFKFN